MMTSASIAPEVKPTNPDSHHFRQHMGRVTGHSAVFFLGTIFNAAAAYGFKIYLARTLGARLLGIYALGMTIVSITGIFNTLGISQASVRFVSSYTATQRFDLGGRQPGPRPGARQCQQQRGEHPGPGYSPVALRP